MNNLQELSFKKTQRAFIGIALIFTLAPILSFAQKVDLSGIWKLNKDKSQFDRRGEAAAAPQIKIVQNSQDVSIERFQKSESGELKSYTEKLSFDGQPVKVTVNEVTTKLAHVNWSADGQILTETADYAFQLSNGNVSNYQGIIVNTLSGDKKTLTVTTDLVVSEDEKYHSVCVYDKSE